MGHLKITTSLDILRSAVFKTTFIPYTCRFYSTPKASKPLRILFCGSDEFSSASLRALHSEQVQNPGIIRSIDVLIRPGKRVGRNLKKVREGKLFNCESCDHH